MNYDDAWNDPNAKIWIKNVLENMAPKLEKSAFIVSIVPEDRSGDVKFWVELGASIMMNKPIIAACIGTTPIPAKLEAVADEIVYLPDGINEEASKTMADAIERVINRLPDQ